MDKNNDIKVYKVSKWKAAPESIGKLKHDLSFLLDKLEVRTYDVDDPEYKELVDEIFKGLDKALNDYNELEAKHNTDCGLISQYAENEKNYDLLMDVHTKYIKESTEREHILKVKLTTAEVSKRNWHARCTELSDICSRNEDDYEMLQRMLEKDGYTVEYDDDIDDETVHCRCTSDYILRGTTPDEVTLQFGRWTLKRPQAFSEAEANAKVAELTAKLIESEFDLAKFKKKYEFQKEKNMELASKNRALGMEISERCKQIHELKDTLEKDRKLAKLVGENVVECIKYGAEHGYYEVHPLNRFDIHIEETHVGSIQDRHAIPKIVVRCNNVWTEMERDTAQHECEELNEKVDRLWRVNEELNRKIKGLEKETNKSLSCPVACECENFKPKVHHSYDPLDDLPDMEHS